MLIPKSFFERTSILYLYLYSSASVDTWSAGTGLHSASVDTSSEKEADAANICIYEKGGGRG